LITINDIITFFNLLEIDEVVAKYKKLLTCNSPEQDYMYQLIGKITRANESQLCLPPVTI